MKPCAFTIGVIVNASPGIVLSTVVFVDYWNKIKRRRKII
jgi:hypothetical protein